ncbi:hypothetical protein [Desulfocapsa sulfexigens]|nr:hypothetical protein [Desulfocapsa sulfexigens]
MRICWANSFRSNETISNSVGADSEVTGYGVASLEEIETTICE